MEENIEAMVDVGISYLEERGDPIDPNTIQTAYEIFRRFLKKSISLENARIAFSELVGNTTALDKLNEIINLPEDPIEQTIFPIETKHNSKSKPWSAQEDQRLLAGIFRYGFDRWNPIALFVGNGRTRSQCAQRWTRGLNPKISKCAWTAEEEAKLINLVQVYGDKSWTKIASEIGKRSDVQCRYRYQQIKKDTSLQMHDNQSMPNGQNTSIFYPQITEGMSSDNNQSLNSSTQISAQTSMQSQALQQVIHSSQQLQLQYSQMHMMNSNPNLLSNSSGLMQNGQNMIPGGANMMSKSQPIMPNSQSMVTSNQNFMQNTQNVQNPQMMTNQIHQQMQIMQMQMMQIPQKIPTQKPVHKPGKNMRNKQKSSFKQNHQSQPQKSSERSQFMNNASQNSVSTDSNYETTSNSIGPSPQSYGEKTVIDHQTIESGKSDEFVIQLPKYNASWFSEVGIYTFKKA